METRSRAAAPSGAARRRRRMAEQDTERRMLDAALEVLAAGGLTVSLEHLGFEEIIQRAGVSRSSVYRRWPYKDLFFADVVKELARSAAPSIVDRELVLIRELIADHADRLGRDASRHLLVTELIRRLAELDFELLRGSVEWRTYLALNATWLSLTDDELREQVRAALAESERAHTERVAGAWRLFVELLGYRLRPEMGATFETLALLMSATMRGMVMTALAWPDLAQQRQPASPFGVATTAEWSLPAIAAASIAWAHLEPDPAVVWDAARVARVREVLAALTPADV